MRVVFQIRRLRYGSWTRPAPKNCAGLDAAQRPVIKQQEHEWQCDECLLGQQARDQEQQRRRQIPARRPKRIAHVHEKRQQTEERAQHIFPFGDPRDRFDVQRMEGKECSDERTFRE